MSVRAKFVCRSIEDSGYLKTAKFSAIYSTTGENKDFAEATPSGDLTIAITGSVPAASFFQPTKCYYLTFEEAPAQ